MSQTTDIVDLNRIETLAALLDARLQRSLGALAYQRYGSDLGDGNNFLARCAVGRRPCSRRSSTRVTGSRSWRPTALIGWPSISHNRVSLRRPGNISECLSEIES